MVNAGFVNWEEEVKNMKYNLFVDESCHLEHDHIPVMCIGYVKVPSLAYDELYKKLLIIKQEYYTTGELKWQKFSKSRLPLYKALVDFFFENPLEFRCVLIKYKDRLNNKDFNQGSHDNFYYKMTYFLLRPNPPDVTYRVFIDLKDTRGKQKLKKLTRYLIIITKANHHSYISNIYVLMKTFSFN